MGTSSSSKGPKGKNPLVPDWADDQPGAPLPSPDPNRFRSFRRSFGEYVASGGRPNLEKVLGKYAREATGGSSVGPRRLGTVISAGGTFAETLRDIAQGKDTSGLKSSDFEGKPVEKFAQALADIISGDSPDVDWIAEAAQEAILVALDIDDNFNNESLTQDNITIILVEFLSISIFRLVLNDAGDAWARADDATDAISRENELLDLTRTMVDRSFRSEMADNQNDLASSRVQGYMRSTAREVWDRWERYND